MLLTMPENDGEGGYHMCVPDGRPHIPEELRRRILVEAGHRCAIPTCRSSPVEIAHIEPWAAVREHAFENLIALCPTCHTRYDRGDIDRPSMRLYKRQLQVSQADAERAVRLAAFCDLTATLDGWYSAINRLIIAELDEESSGSPDDAAARRGAEVIRRCRNELTAAWKRAQDAMSRFRVSCDDEFFGRAVGLYDATKSWADDVTDGLWPSTHMGADQHDDVSDRADELYEYASTDLQVSEEDLASRAERTWRDHATRLGGTGKRF
jgi:hypothetical protein